MPQHSDHGYTLQAQEEAPGCTVHLADPFKALNDVLLCSETLSPVILQLLDLSLQPSGSKVAIVSAGAARLGRSAPQSTLIGSSEVSEGRHLRHRGAS